MSFRLFVYHKLAGILPETRSYPVKARLLRYCGFDVHPAARIVSSAKFIGSFSLSIGEDTYIGHEVLIAGGQCTISIGHGCDLAPRVSLIAGSHEVDMVGLHTAGKGYSQNIIIKDGVWIGAGAIVLGGVTIGEKAVIAAGSIVKNDIPSFVIAAGNPCKPIKLWDHISKSWKGVDNIG
jgi:maltose O-acetyltransferase